MPGGSAAQGILRLSLLAAVVVGLLPRRVGQRPEQMAAAQAEAVLPEGMRHGLPLVPGAAVVALPVLDWRAVTSRLAVQVVVRGQA
jgi:hypothetical protein